MNLISPATKNIMENDSGNTRRDAILENDPDLELLSADGLDGAIIGLATAFSEPRLVYSVSKCLQILMAEDNEPDEEGYDKYTRAREHFDFNVAGGYVGEQTPIWVEDSYFESMEGEDEAEVRENQGS